MSIDPETMEELLASDAHERLLRPLRQGETVHGTVASVSGTEATVDLGDRPAGVVTAHGAGGAALEPGQQVSAVVVEPEGPDGRVVLSLRGVRDRRRWDEMEQLRVSGELVEAPVVDANRGGVVVDVGMRGFVPMSQLDSIGPIDTAGLDVPEPVRALVGKRVSLRVIEVDPRRDRLILSEKAATRQLRRTRKAAGASQLKVGDVCDGVIVSVTAYGIFVDVGVADGLVHRSEITWNSDGDAASRFAVGQRVRVMVVGIDRERQRISLSIRRLSLSAPRAMRR